MVTYGLLRAYTRPTFNVTVVIDNNLVVQKRFVDEFTSDDSTADKFEQTLKAHNEKFNSDGVTQEPRGQVAAVLESMFTSREGCSDPNDVLAVLLG